MTLAIILFAATYVLMLAFSKYRPWFALGSGALFILTGMLPAEEILGALDFNVLLMIGGTMALSSSLSTAGCPSGWRISSWSMCPMSRSRLLPCPSSPE